MEGPAFRELQDDQEQRAGKVWPVLPQRIDDPGKGKTETVIKHITRILVRLDNVVQYQAILCIIEGFSLPLF